MVPRSKGRLLRATSIDHWQFDPRRLGPSAVFRSPIQFDSGKSRQFFPRRIRAFTDDGSIEQDQRQARVAVLLQRGFDDRAGREGLWLLCQVIAFNGNPLVG